MLKNELLNKIDIHKINELVFEDQLKKKMELKKNGILEKGLKKRGYELDYKKKRIIYISNFGEEKKQIHLPLVNPTNKSLNINGLYKSANQNSFC